jgi:hypothetical protein
MDAGVLLMSYEPNEARETEVPLIAFGPPSLKLAGAFCHLRAGQSTVTFTVNGSAGTERLAIPREGV